MSNTYSSNDFIYNIDTNILDTFDLGEDSLIGDSEISLQQLLKLSNNSYPISSVILGLEQEFNKYITLEEFIIEYLPFPRRQVKEIVLFIDEPYTLLVRDIFCERDILYLDIVENINVCKIDQTGNLQKIGSLPLGLQEYPVNKIKWLRVPNNYLWEYLSLGM